MKTCGTGQASFLKGETSDNQNGNGGRKYTQKMGFEGKLNKAFLLFLPILCCIIFQFDYFGFRNGPIWKKPL